MNIDELNKQQIVLLTLLVSIVTSVATGITVISLVGQNPVQTVTQTVNRVVERTIETIIEPTKGDDEEKNTKPIEKEIVTVVVNAEDLTIDAIERNSKSIVRVIDSKTGIFISIGVIIKNDGTIYLPAFAYNKRASYVGEFEGGTFPLELVLREDVNDLVIMKPVLEETPIEFSTVNVGSSESLKLGQSVISLSGSKTNTVSIGVVTSINVSEETSDLISINTSVNSGNIVRGSILLNLQGKVVGIKSGIEGNASAFSPSSKIFNYLNESTEAETEEVA